MNVLGHILTGLMAMVVFFLFGWMFFCVHGENKAKKKQRARRQKEMRFQACLNSMTDEDQNWFWRHWEIAEGKDDWPKGFDV